MNTQASKLVARFGITPEAAEALVAAGLTGSHAINAATKTALKNLLPEKQVDKIWSKRHKPKKSNEGGE